MSKQQFQNKLEHVRARAYNFALAGAVASVILWTADLLMESAPSWVAGLLNVMTVATLFSAAITALLYVDHVVVRFSEQ